MPAQWGVENGITSSEFLAIKPKDGINKYYLAEYLRSPFIAAQAIKAIGARMPRVSSDTFLDYIIPVPPPEVQKHIAKKLQMLNHEIELTNQEIHNKRQQIQNDIEAVILGQKKIGEI